MWINQQLAIRNNERARIEMEKQKALEKMKEMENSDFTEIKWLWIKTIEHLQTKGIFKKEQLITKTEEEVKALELPHLSTLSILKWIKENTSTNPEENE